VSGTTKIEWTDHTFNPWWGCVKVSPGCDHCYAEGDAKRYGHQVWGKDAPRRFLSDHHWAQPLRWNRDAANAGERRGVFCASMADVFEERDDLDPLRERLWDVIRQTPCLDWQLLTKRPDVMRRELPADLASLQNVWLGTTVESADYLWRIEKLLSIDCAGPRWISYEPALGPVNFRPYFTTGIRGHIEWIIIGGESGAGARPFDPAWAAQTIADGAALGVAVFLKQFGSRLKLRDYKGGDMSEWPEHLRVRQYPRERSA